MGRVGRPHGVRGAVVVHPETDHPDRFRAGARMTTAAGDSLTVESVTRRGTSLVVRFREVTGRDAAERLRGLALGIPASARRPLAEDEYWPDELVGARVLDLDGRPIGTILEVVEGVAQDRLRVETDDGVVEIPFVEELVPDVDVAGGVVRVRPIEGLFSR